MRKMFICGTVLLLVGVVVGQVRAQGPAGIAIEMEVIDGAGAESGSILCNGEEGLGLCADSYATSMFGVLTNAPVAAMESELIAGQMVVTSGEMSVLVSGEGGDIEVGDMITSSRVAGVGQKARERGYVLGTALEAVSFVSADEVRLVSTLLNIHVDAGVADGRSNLVSALKIAGESPVLNPLDTFRYFLAAVMVMIAFLMGFTYFGRMARAGVEAMGRNPLAARQIQLNIIVNSIVTVAIIGGGLAISYLILIV
jgi:hypothetical protein